MSPRKTILHVITGVDVGGAEFMLARTVAQSDRSRYRHVIVSMKGEGDLSRQLRAAGAELISLSLNTPASLLCEFLRLRRLIRREQPAAVQTWLAHATLFGSLAAWSAGNRRVIWCVHTGNQDPSRVAREIRIINHILGALSRALPRIIVSVSEAASRHCIRLGFPQNRIRLIPNGTDTAAFQPDPAAGAALRREFQIPENAPLVGIVGRNTPEKDFATFFRAALQLQDALPQTHFLLCGKGLEPSMPEAREFLPQSVHPENFHFLGIRKDVARVYNACTIVVLTSVSEAFPLVLGEAMACGVPVAATDVGDCRLLVGDGGEIAPPRQAEAIASSWAALLRLPSPDYHALSGRARQRIVTHYSMRPCMERYEELYEQLSGSKAGFRLPANSPAPAPAHPVP